DDGVVDRPARAALPHHGGLALVGDADGVDIAGLQAGPAQGLARGGQLAVPDLHRVVLDPAGLRVDLADLALGHGHEAAGLVEDDAARTGGALVEGQQVAHDLSPVSVGGLGGIIANTAR